MRLSIVTFVKAPISERANAVDVFAFKDINGSLLATLPIRSTIVRTGVGFRSMLQLAAGKAEQLRVTAQVISLLFFLKCRGAKDAEKSLCWY